MRTFMAASVGALILCVSVWGQAPENALPPRPGSINYVEGEASIGSQPLNASSIGSAALGPGQSLTTQTGKVEMLLTPGVFLRLDDNSSVKMISPDLANTEVEIDKGRAMVEVTDISKDNNIRVDEHGASVKLLKTGLYDFDADRGQFRVFKGEASVYAPGKNVKVKSEHEVTFSPGGTLEAQKFDTRPSEDDFFRWNALRSGYMSEAAADEGRAYVSGGPGWNGFGWYWDPEFGAYTFIPGDGIFYSPFGWGFYSPFFLYRSPFYYGGHFGRPHRFGDFHAPYGHGIVPPGEFHGGGFRGGGAFRGGGRHR